MTALLSSLFIFTVASTSSSAAPVPARPTNAALRKAWERNAHTLVEVSDGKRSGTGVIVGAAGHIVTTVDHVGLYEATVTLEGQQLPGRVIAANARLKIAVVQISPPDGADLRAPAADLEKPLRKGTWVVGIHRANPRAASQQTSSAATAPSKPVAGRVLAGAGAKSPFIVTDLPLPPGSPLFDSSGRLVAVVVERVGKIGSRALPVSEVQAQVRFAQGTTP